MLVFTFVWHNFTCLEVHLGAAGRANLVDVVTELVAAILPAVEAHSLVKRLLGVAPVCHALLLSVQQRVDKQVDGALVGAFDELVHICDAHRAENKRNLFIYSQMTLSKRENAFLMCGFL